MSAKDSPNKLPEPAIVLGIPGKWKDRSDIVASIARRSGGYLFASKVLMHTVSGVPFELEVYDHDLSLADKVRSGGMGQIPEEDLAALKDHTFTLYLLSDEAGRDAVAKMMDAAVGLLDAGGLVVKVEKAGFFSERGTMARTRFSEGGLFPFSFDGGFGRR